MTESSAPPPPSAARPRASLRSLLVRGAAGSIGVGLITLAVQFGAHVLLARILGAAEYGVYMYATSWMAILLLPGRAGMDVAVVVYAAGYRARAEWGRLRALLRRGPRIALLAGACSGAIMALVSQLVLSNGRLAGTFLIASVVLPVISMITVIQAALRGLGHIASSRALDPLIRLMILSGGVVTIWLVSGEVDATLGMLLNGCAAGVVLAVGVAYLGRCTPPEVRSAPAVAEYRRWWAMAIPSALSSGMGVLLKQADVILIGILMQDVAAVAIYSVAARIATLAGFGLTAVNAAVAPMASSLYHTDRLTELRRIARFAARGILAITVPIAAGLAILRGEALSIFGAGFVSGADALLILLGGQVVNALCGSVGQIMSTAERQRAKLAILVGGVALNLGLNIMLIPVYGLVGAAVATAAATVLWNVTMSIYLVHELGIDPTVFALLRSRQSEVE